MHDIRDLSDLITLLAEQPGTSLQLSIHPEVQKSLAGCLELGVSHIVRFDSMALAPRALMAIAENPGVVPRQKAFGKDFQNYFRESSGDDMTFISVCRGLLVEALDWVDQYPRSARFQAIYSDLEAISKTDLESVRAPISYVQEVVDWLDLIQRNRPNDCAEDLRQDVAAHNPTGLKPKIVQPGAYR
ncbi:hypothetical protein [Pseudomonas serbica]|jgi:hypothetical protein|uniref:hypothetical protein n=1 Tax=Pseudomonas serbica TaxID=2965074 RepID=UPI00237BA2DB|nr:hypothetical protein [Pseudomonas serbica]